MAFIGLLSFAAIIIGLFALIKGNLLMFRIKDRKTAALVLGAGFLLFVFALSATPEAEETIAENGTVMEEVNVEQTAEETIAEEKVDDEVLEFKGDMELKVVEDQVVMTITSNVPVGGIFELAVANNQFDIVSDFVEIQDGKIEKEFDISEWDIGYITGMAMFRFNLEEHPQPDHIKEIYGEKGEKMKGEQAVETFDGGYFGNVEAVTIAYPDEATVQAKLDELFINALKELIEVSEGVIRKIEPQGTWEIVHVIVSDSWYYSMDYEKERFAETVGSTLEQIIKSAGKVANDDIVHVYFYDAYGKELAAPGIFGGYKIK